MPQPFESEEPRSCGKIESVYAVTFRSVNASDIDEGNGKDMDASDSFVGDRLVDGERKSCQAQRC
jgi:hypothetical protein